MINEISCGTRAPLVVDYAAPRVEQILDASKKVFVFVQRRGINILMAACQFAGDPHQERDSPGLHGATRAQVEP
jgi:hypothetical protein